MFTAITRRPFGRKQLLGLAGAVAVAGVASASIAMAQVGPAADGGPAGGAAAAPIVTNCGANLGSTVITRNSPTITNQVGFAPLPGAVRNFVVPDNQSRCIKVLFTAESACGLTAAPDFCYVQAFIDGVPMDPNGAGFEAFDSEDGTASAHALEWVKRVGPGNHVVTLQWRVLAAGTPFYLDDWTLDIGTYA